MQIFKNVQKIKILNEKKKKNRSKLRRSGSMFEADLHKKRFVDLILEGKRMEAINYVRENVSNSKYFNDVWQQDLKKVIFVLLFGEVWFFLNDF